MTTQDLAINIINTGQNAPKAKKPPVAFNEEDLYDDSGPADGSNEAWMRKMEKEWRQANDINRMIARDEALAKEARLAMTSKGPLCALSQVSNPLV